jgi:iron(III) transport system ATP-binding protein
VTTVVYAAGSGPDSAAASSDDVGAEPVLKVEHLHKTYRRANGVEVPAIDDVSFDLAAGKFMVLLGPSGCGKTTLLRCVAGLERPDSGRIEVGGRTVFSGRDRNVPPELRGLSMVFQSYALWPHMTVFQNIAYPLRSLPRSKRPSKAEIAQRVNEVMETAGIPTLGGQYPNSISGGQQQRAALCRALVAGSNVVLFDEPLSNIDAQVREHLRNELLTMQRRLGFAALYVTHDRQEAMSMAHSMLVLDTGRIAQAGPPGQIYVDPATPYVARFTGPTNELPVSIGARTGESTTATTPGGLRIVGRASDFAASDLALAMWRPERCPVSAREPETPNRWRGKVERAQYYGSYTEYFVETPDGLVRAVSDQDEPLAVDDEVWVSVSPRDVMFLEREQTV